MVFRRHALAVLAAVLVLGAGPSAQTGRKQTETRAKDIQAIVAAADSVHAGAQAPDELALAWVREDFLKAQERKTYVPFTVSIDPTKTPGGMVDVYWRVAAKGSPAPLPASARDARKHNEKLKYAYEDLATVNVVGRDGGRISRSFTVPGGVYDVLVLVKEMPGGQKSAPAPKISVLRREVTVPDFWNGALSTSSLIIVERIDPIPAPLSKEQKADRPYALGTFEIVPSYATRFPKSSELSTFMQIYNTGTDADDRPDVVVECSFYRQQPDGGETFFNKTLPQNLNAQTMPPEFSFAAGHQLQTGQAVGLSTFPEGDYRLEIKVTDKIANKTLTRDLRFTVGPS